MSKSRYPNNLDTSAEIPAVRDNILESGSDVINSLRSAIFNIEKALGINPQGATGNSLSDRLNRSLDGNGNIKSEALNRANVLTGPISDQDVSRHAAIQESKLKLNYPTNLLQSEISVLNSQIDTIADQIDELSTLLSLHLSNSSNRHLATSISISEYTSLEGDTAASNITSGDVQTTFQDIYDGHINFSGNNISSENNSHKSSQIFFDDANIETIIQADDVQEAIEEIAGLSNNLGQLHQDLFHSNGLINIAKIVSPEDISSGRVLAEDVSVSFNKSVGNDKIFSVITINDTIPLGIFNLQKSDLITISDVSDITSAYIGIYEIISFEESDDNLISVTVYGVLGGASTSLTKAKISKNTNQESNTASLLCAARENPTLTSSQIVQVCNPASTRVISSGIKPSEITISNRYIDISIDDQTLTLDLFNNSISNQSLDSVISRINEQCSESAYNFLAYRIDYKTSSELVLAHNLPDTSDEMHTITISRSSDDGIDASGFSYIEDLEISSIYGSAFYLSGISYTQLESKLDSLDLNFSSSSLIINNLASDDFIILGIKKNDLLIITDSTDDSNNGSYIIDTVASNQLTISSSQLPSGFVSSSTESTRFRIYKNTVSFDSITFNEVSSTFGAILFDLYLDKSLNLIYDKRFEYSSSIISSKSVFSLIDFDGATDDTYQVRLSDVDSNSISISINDGEEVIVRGDNSYVWVNDKNSTHRFKFLIPSIDDVKTKILSLAGDVLENIYGFNKINSDSNLFISRVLFNNFNGRLAGGDSAPRALSKIRHGMIGINDLSDEVISVVSEIPLDELRANGIVRGLEISASSIENDLYKISILPGIAYINGKRIESNGVTDLITDLNSTLTDKIYIAINENGVFKFESALPICISPFEGINETLLGSLEFDNVNLFTIDLRLFINELDLKILNAITVSPDSSLAHFNDLSKALKYVKRFSFMFPKAGTPSLHLKSGTHVLDISYDINQTFSDWNSDYVSTPNVTVSEFIDKQIKDGFIIDFPVNIIGEGDSTEVQITSSMTFTDVSYDFRGFLGIFGDGFTYHTYPLDVFSSGFITFKDFKLINTRIELGDLNVFSGITPLLFGINIDNITFDFRSFTANPFDSAIGEVGIRLAEYADVISDKGNVTINNCSFIDSNIYLSSESRTKNLNVSYNKIMNDSTLPLFNLDVYTFATADAGSNINLYGNINNSNFNDNTDPSRPNIISGSSDGWGDRIGRDLRIGTDLFVGNEATIPTLIVENIATIPTINADQYAYSPAKTRTRFYTFDKLAYDSSSGALFYNVSNTGLYTNDTFTDSDPETISWPTVQVRNIRSFRYKIDINEGEILTGIVLGVESDGPIQWNIEIESAEPSLGTSATSMFTSLDTDSETTAAGPFFYRITELSMPTTFNIVGDADTFYFIKVNCDDASLKHLYWIKAIYSVSSVESGLNLT